MNQTVISPSSTPISSDSIHRIAIAAVTIAVSSFGVTSNLAVVIVISLRSQLRNNCKLLQAGLAMGDGLTSLGIFFNQILNIVLNTVLPKPALFRWQCLGISTLYGLGLLFSTFMILCIAIDRLVAITRPIRYKNLNKFKCFVICVTIAASGSGACTIAMFAEITTFYDVPPVCVGSSARGPRFEILNNIINLSAGAILLILYPIIVINLRLKLRQHNTASNAASQNPTGGQFSKQLEATIAVLCVLLADLLLHAVPNTVLLILNALDFNTSVTARAYVALGSCAHSSINCLLYIWKEPKMRDQLKQLLFWRCASHSNSVNSITPGNTD